MTDNNNIFDDTTKFHEGSNVIHSKFEGYNFVGRYATVTYSEFGKYSYVSQFSVVKNTKIGKFTSISWGCSIGPEDHDFNRLTASSVLTSTKTFTLFDHKFYNPFNRMCSIGNDCWIGCGSTVLRGVNIPDGVVIGANSVVTVSPPPYAIVVGSPAKVIKYRFESEVIDMLLQIQWWNYNDEVIKKLEPIFAKEKLNLGDVKELKRYLENNHGKI